MTKRDEHVDEVLDRYRTGELDAAERGQVEGHLASCEACRTALAGLEAFARTVERAYAAETAALAREREPDWGRLRTAIVGRTSTRGTAPRRSWLTRHAPQAALAVLVFVALGVLWRQGIREPVDADRALRDERPTAAERARAPEEAPPAAPPEAAVEALDERMADVAQPEEEVAAAADAANELEAGAEGRDRLGRAEAAAKADAVVPADLDRFRERARAALGERDPVLAERALAQWRDSLGAGEGLPEDLRRAAQVLADSLADFLARRP